MRGSQEPRVFRNSERAFATGIYGKGHYSKIKNKYRRYFSKKKNLFIVFGLILSVLLATTAIFYMGNKDVLLRGITISGIDVGNLSKDEAKSLISNEINQLENKTITLNVGKKSIDVKLKELGLSISSDSALQKAYDLGRSGSLGNRLLTKLSVSRGVNIDLTSSWDDQKLKTCLDKNLVEYNDPAKDASFTITPQNTMAISSEHEGLVYDQEDLISQIKKLNIFKPADELKVNFKKQTPQVTAQQLEDQKITGLLASYTTYFNSSQIERSENVRIAAKALNMAVIKPGDTLSFNKIVGERTVEGGYKDAYIIVNGQFVKGLAGGICQVSSTLYNTGLLANLQVIQRSNHDLAISYVPLGQDATVSYPDLDLKFNNNTGGYLLIRTMTGSNSLTIQLYGKVKEGQEVSISDKTESVIPAGEERQVDKTLKSGESVVKQHGQPGYVVSSVRTVKMNGKVVSSEPLNKSVYKSVPTIIAVGS